jgi:hypothetical protein
MNKFKTRQDYAKDNWSDDFNFDIMESNRLEPSLFLYNPIDIIEVQKAIDTLKKYRDTLKALGILDT